MMNAGQYITESGKTQIVLIATHHSVLFLHPRYSPAHLRALLAKINPVAVCIEEPPDWQEHWSLPPTWPQELYATITWAEKQNMRVWGVDWQDDAGTNFLPLSGQEVDAGWHNDDAIMLLGVNLDSWKIPGAPQSRNHQQSKFLLGKLSLIYPHSPVTRYYQAKWRLLFGDLTKAKEILQGILREGTHTSIPYYPDWRWSWPPFPIIEHKARFNMATIYDLEGNHKAAIELYQQLLEVKPESLLTPKNWRYDYIDLRSYIENLIVDPYRGSLWEAFRAKEYSFYTLTCILGPSRDDAEEDNEYL